MFDKLLTGIQNLLRHNRRSKGGIILRDDFNVQILGVAKFERMHGNDVVETVVYKNIVTQRASILVQKRLAEQSNTRGITHFAIGLGETWTDRDPNYDDLNMNGGKLWNCYAPPSAKTRGGRTDKNYNKPCLYDEIARKKIDVIQYLNKADDENSVSTQPTNIAQYKALFLEKEGNGPIMEFALFGGTVWPSDRDYIPSYKTDDNGVLLKASNGKYIPNDGNDKLIDPGDMFTYRTHKLFYKTSSDRLRLTYTIEIAMNQAPDEPPAD